MLLGVDAPQRQQVADGERAHRAARAAVVVVGVGVDVHRTEPFLDEGGHRRARLRVLRSVRGLERGGEGLVDRFGHLRGQRAAPDQFVHLEREEEETGGEVER